MLISMPTGTSTIFGVFQAILCLQVYGANAAVKLRPSLEERKRALRHRSLTFRARRNCGQRSTNPSQPRRLWASSLPAYNDWHLTTVRTGALISVFPRRRAVAR